MIVLTVKTLDSQNHSFTVDDDITVAEFKTKIADTVKISADTQRIIYCGRVLQDEVKLSDYDVHGKVVHLVQRPPPGTNPPTNRPRSPSPQPPRRVIRSMDGGNAMYLGSMSFPSNLIESPGLVPPPPTHNLAGSRLTVARRMLRRADAVISLLENPSARPNEQPAADDQQEEVTPIIEARVIVPPDSNEPIDEQMVLSAVQNSLFEASTDMPITAEVSVEGPSSQNGAEASSTERSSPSTPVEDGTEDVASGSNSNEGASTSNEQRNGSSNGRNLAENACRTSEMAELLTMLNQLQARFAPFLERYRHFMVEDPVIPPENARQTQAMLSRVSEVLHFLGHAYHSLSDIIIRVRTPPPRPLLCRPILIQHSAVLQAGIPIQVEVAQFNLSAERPTSTTNATTTTTSNNSTSTESSPSVTPTTSATTTTNSEETAPSAPAHVQNQPTVLRTFPFMPGTSMRVQSFPFELRTGSRPVNGGVPLRPQNNNNNTMAQSASTGASATTTVAPTAATPAMEGPTFVPNFNNSSVEVFMEVTPEAFTVLQGGINGPPPELLQSLIQMAGQIMDRVTTTSAPTASSDTVTSTGASTTDASQPGVTSQTAAGQNSQARGNTQTNPTTATHTRSTPRPHVHLAQQAMQGGFDPFLPCNSHHVTHRRRNQQATTASQNGTQSTTRQQQPQPQQTRSRTVQRITPWDLQNFISNLPQNRTAAAAAAQGTQPSQQQRPNETETEPRRDSQTILNVVDHILNDFRVVFARQPQNDGRSGGGSSAGAGESQAASTTTTGVNAAHDFGNTEVRPPSQTASASGVSSTSTNETRRPSHRSPFASNVQSALAGVPIILQGPTIADLLQQLPSDDMMRPGESIMTDLIFLLARNLTLVDVIALNGGNFEPLSRVAGELQSFVLTRVLDGSTSRESINTGVDRIIGEMQPFFQSCNRLRAREGVDVIRSVECLFRRRLPELITTAANITYDNMRNLVNQCIALLKMMFTLVLNVSSNGQEGVEQTFGHIMMSYMEGVPLELQNWTVMTSRSNLRSFISGLNVPDGVVEQYIVRCSDVAMSGGRQHRNDERTTASQDSEPMELDEPELTSDAADVEFSSPPSASPPVEIGIVEDAEPLPNIVLGTEPWHDQVSQDWVPIITRDVQRQRRQNPQGPFSDAYLSGMPTKRRRIVASTKPQGSLPQVISESVRRAVTATGLQSAAPLEAVSQAAGDSPDLQTAYRSLLRSTVQTALRDNEDFTPDRFPNAATYFKPE